MMKEKKAETIFALAELFGISGNYFTFWTRGFIGKTQFMPD